MYNTGIIRFKLFNDLYGKLNPIEGGIDIPFEIKRVYYIYDVQSEVVRGFHSHKRLHQVLIALGGSIKVRLKTPDEEVVYKLDNPGEGLYIGPNIWREMYDFSKGSTLLVLASQPYDESDYIRNYDHFITTNPYRS
ncbi:sugar 3,4-ketoisomerase [Paenibacillus qinlingensis]|uniref:sugar 3,4-ketoisomerase n=1 Tax=Paenibacillus qinlingensis TaxID=1837343 RepID=UPI00156407D4|nr:FdtA/QdtA family cupin domain-containing protein [Paenibacillus qinlingensis]NQX60242.1 WxcM-like domain-containing protein [Paenibacillus qinlingensis]